MRPRVGETVPVVSFLDLWDGGVPIEKDRKAIILVEGDGLGNQSIEIKPKREFIQYRCVAAAMGEYTLDLVCERTRYDVVCIPMRLEDGGHVPCEHDLRQRQWWKARLSRL
jgi:hypothetical protein